jgi:hypothetical protein
MAWFAEMIAKTLFLGRPDLTRKYEIKRENRTIFNGIAHHFVLFAVAHEYAHCILGHHLIDSDTDERGPVEQPLVGTLLPPKISALWADEFEADEIGYQLTYQAAERARIPKYMALCGPDLFFMSGRILEQGMAALNDNLFDGPTANAGTKTHPPMQLRYHSLRRVAKENGAADDAVRFSKAVSGLVGAMQKHAHLSLLMLKGEGKTLDPIWNELNPSLRYGRMQAGS